MGFFGKIVGKAVNDAIYKASDGKKMVSTDYSKAAINIMKRKIEDITFFVSVLASVVFLGFYAFMIYSKHDSLVNIIIYSVLSFLLIISSVIDILIFCASRKEMNFLKKRNFLLYKKIKRNSLLIFKGFIKLFSIGYGIFIVIKYGQTTGRVISIASSIVALLLQLAVHFIACFITDCINYIVMGITMDVDNSGILFLVDKDKREKNLSNEFLRTKSDKIILEELEIQKEKDSAIKDEDDEIKIKYGKYQLECKDKANFLKLNPKKLEEAIKISYSKYENTNEFNETPVEILKVINLVEEVYNKTYDKLSEDAYTNALAFIVYYNNLYDASKRFRDSSELYILDKIFTEINGLKEFIEKNK